MAQLKKFVDILDNNYKNDKLILYDIGIYNEDYQYDEEIKESYTQFMKKYINNYLTEYSNKSDEYNGLFYLDYAYFGNEFYTFKKFKTNNIKSKESKESKELEESEESEESESEESDGIYYLTNALREDTLKTNDDNNNDNIISHDLYPLIINFNDLWYRKAKIYMLNNNLFYIKNISTNVNLEESLYYLISPTHALFDIHNLIVKRINFPNIILQDTNPILLTFKTDNYKLLEYMHTLYYNIPTIQSYMNEDIKNNNKKRKII